MKIEIWKVYEDKNYCNLKVKVQAIYSPSDREYASIKKEANYKWQAKIVKYLKTTLVSIDEPFTQDGMYMVWIITLTNFKKNFILYT